MKDKLIKLNKVLPTLSIIAGLVIILLNLLSITEYIPIITGQILLAIGILDLAGDKLGINPFKDKTK